MAEPTSIEHQRGKTGAKDAEQRRALAFAIGENQKWVIGVVFIEL